MAGRYDCRHHLPPQAGSKWPSASPLPAARMCSSQAGVAGRCRPPCCRRLSLLRLGLLCSSPCLQATAAGMHACWVVAHSSQGSRACYTSRAGALGTGPCPPAGCTPRHDSAGSLAMLADTPEPAQCRHDGHDSAARLAMHAQRPGRCLGVAAGKCTAHALTIRTSVAAAAAACSGWRVKNAAADWAGRLWSD